MQSKSKVAAVLSTLLLLFLVSSTAMAGNNRISVLTWNIHGSTSPNKPIIPRDISAVKNQLVVLQNLSRLFQLPISVFAFQEIYSTQANELADALHIPRSSVFFTRTNSGTGTPFGNAIMTPLLNYVTTAGREGRSTDYLFKTEADYNRTGESDILSGMTVILPNGQKLRVYNTHLVGDNSLSDQAANNAAYAWLQLSGSSVYIDNNGLPYPSIMMGDFNIHPPTTPATPTAAYLPDYKRFNYLALIWLGFRDLWAEWAPSHGNPNQITEPGHNFRLDYIVTRGPRVGVVSMAVADTGTASDHRPMIANLTF